MAVKIRLKRLGKVRVPQYRIVVVDSRKKRDGRVIEEIGKYHPKEDPSVVDVVSDRAQYWLGVGAQPTDTVQTLLRITGDWQKFRGLPGTEGRLKVAAEKRSKLDIFNEALKEAGSDSVEATTPKPSKKDDARAAKDAEAVPAATADEVPAEVPGEETPEGATEVAEVEETKALDDEKQQEPEDGAKGDADGADSATPSS